MVHDSQEKFFVVKNHEDQYSIWAAFMPLPRGWETIGEAAPKQDCLATIESVWTDMRPRSLRHTMQKD